ncbi:hypothetical protein [uncultured Enterovirga sp.]|uniref:hypothetical protein n=1 Tax=uncultured Enterovirga sp. TaxID=2026352 RepID=UPI0035C98E71
MSRLVWTFGWIGVAVWSLVCAAVYGVFDLVGRLLSRNADTFATDPTTVEWLWRVLNFLHSLSTGAVVVAWAVVSLLILAVPWVLDRMLGAPERGHVTARYRTGGPMGRDDGVIDLAPDQYSVGPAPGRSPPPGPAPRISPRS